LSVNYTVKSKTKESNYKCSICDNLFVEPVDHVKCGYTFCTSCILTRDDCPKCQEVFDLDDIHKSSLAFTNSLMAVKVICCTCKKITTVLEFELHYNEVCEVECIHGCGKIIKRNELEQHEQECDKYVRACIGIEFGCTYKDSGINYMTHMAECHYAINSTLYRVIFSELYTYNEKLSIANCELNDKLDGIKKDLTGKSEQLCTSCDKERKALQQIAESMQKYDKKDGDTGLVLEEVLRCIQSVNDNLITVSNNYEEMIKGMHKDVVLSSPEEDGRGSGVGIDGSMQEVTGSPGCGQLHEIECEGQNYRFLSEAHVNETLDNYKKLELPDEKVDEESAAKEHVRSFASKLKIKFRCSLCNHMTDIVAYIVRDEDNSYYPCCMQCNNEKCVQNLAERGFLLYI